MVRVAIASMNSVVTIAICTTCQCIKLSTAQIEIRHSSKVCTSCSSQVCISNISQVCISNVSQVCISSNSKASISRSCQVCISSSPPCALIEFMGRSSAVVLSALCSRRTISALTAPCALQSVPQWFFAPQCFAKRAAVVLCSRRTII